MKVEIWSDVACPWCHIGKRRFEAALERFAHRTAVEVHWRSFELDPHAESGTGPQTDPRAYAVRLARKYATSVPGAQQMLDTMTAAAAGEGLDFRFDRAVRANTFQAHQVLHLAHERGLQDAMKERLLLAMFTQGEAVGDADVLVRLAGEVGLDEAEVRQALADQRYAPAVREDEAEATALGITGVPFFVVDRRFGVSGAQPAGELLRVLEHAWDERPSLVTVGAGADAAHQGCGPDGCSL